MISIEFKRFGKRIDPLMANMIWISQISRDRTHSADWREPMHVCIDSRNQHKACSMQKWATLHARNLGKVPGSTQCLATTCYYTTQLSLEKSFWVCDSPSSLTPLPPCQSNYLGYRRGKNCKGQQPQNIYLGVFCNNWPSLMN